MPNRPKICKVRHKAKFSGRALLWGSLTAEQQQAATEKYFNGEGTPEDYFTYEPDGFLVVDGKIYDIDAEATTDFDFSSSWGRSSVEHPGWQLRLLPSSVANGKGLVIHYQNICDPVYQVYSVELTNG